MEEFRQRTCPIDSVIFALTIGSIIILITIIGIIFIGFVAWKKRKSKRDVIEAIYVDMNHGYVAAYYDAVGSEVKDANEYYFYAKPEDDIEITDTNDYYER